MDNSLRRQYTKEICYCQQKQQYRNPNRDMIVYSKQLTNRKNSATIATVEYTVQYRVGLDGSALLYCYTVYTHTFSCQG